LGQGRRYLFKPSEILLSSPLPFFLQLLPSCYTMPRAYTRKIRCAYDTPMASAERKAKAPKAKAPRPQLTDIEKQAKKTEATERKEAKERKKQWEEGIKVWTGGEGYRGIKFPNGTKVLFKSDAKREFGLNDKEIASLPFYGFAGSRKTVFKLDDLSALAESKAETLGTSYPAQTIPPQYRVKTTDYLTGLKGMDSKDKMARLVTGLRYGVTLLDDPF